MMKVRKFFSENTNETILQARISNNEFEKHGMYVMEQLVYNEIASRLADIFCQKYGEEILSKINHQFVIDQIMRSEVTKDREKLEEAILSGRCLGCTRVVRDWKAPDGSFAPEAWATLREQGIDPANGHTESCKYNPGNKGKGEK